MELIEYLLAEVGPGLALESVHVHESVEAHGTKQVIVMNVDPGFGEQTIAGEVVFMRMAVHHRVDRNASTTAFNDGDRRVDDDGLPRPLHDHRIPGRVGPIVWTDQNGYPIGELSGVFIPRSHQLDATWIWAISSSVASWMTSSS